MKSDNGTHSGTPQNNTHDTINGRVSVLLDPKTGTITTLSPLERIAQIFANHPDKDNIDQKVLDTLDSALKGQSWAMKDIFYYINNKKGGVPESEELKKLGIQVLKEAAADGNIQANRDLKELISKGLVKADETSQEQTTGVSPTNDFSKTNLIKLITRDGAEKLKFSTANDSSKISSRELEIKESIEELGLTRPKDLEAAPASDPSPIERLAQIFADHKISHKAQKTLESAQNGNPQAKNDLFYFANNGLEGVPKNKETFDNTYKLLKEAAADGNINAISNLAFVNYHGVGGVDPSPEDAIASMIAIGFTTKDDIFEHWQPGYRKSHEDKVIESYGVDPKDCVDVTYNGEVTKHCGLNFKLAFHKAGVDFSENCAFEYDGRVFHAICP